MHRNLVLDRSRAASRAKQFVVVMFTLCTVVTAQPPPNGTDSLVTDGAEYEDDYDSLYTKSNQTYALVNFTMGLLKQDLGVFGQAVRVPYSRFTSHPCQVCEKESRPASPQLAPGRSRATYYTPSPPRRALQVVYLGNPDWSTLSLQVTFTNTPNSTCLPDQQPQAALAYIDGYKVPRSVSRVVTSSGKAMWVAAVRESESLSGTAVPGVQQQPPPAATASSTARAPAKRAVLASASGAAAGLVRKLRRRLIASSLFNRIPGLDLKSGR
jgi:hypothetical protein